MFESVGQTFLNDAIGGELDPSRERERLPVDMQLDGQAGAADFFYEQVEAVEARLRQELGFVPVAGGWPPGDGASR